MRQRRPAGARPIHVESSRFSGRLCRFESRQVAHPPTGGELFLPLVWGAVRFDPRGPHSGSCASSSPRRAPTEKGVTAMAVKPIPDGYHTITPYLYIKGAASAIDFYKKAFGAEEIMRFGGPDGKIGHAEIRIGNSPIMMADEHPGMNVLGPSTRGGTTVGFALYVADVDASFAKAVAAGAKIDRPIKNQFYGDRSGTL